MTHGQQEFARVNPWPLNPLRRLAVGLFYDVDLPIERKAGTEMERDGRLAGGTGRCAYQPQTTVSEAAGYA